MRLRQPGSDQVYREHYFVVISDDRFHSSGRDEVQLIEPERPFNPIPVERSRVVPITYMPPDELAKLQRSLMDLLVQDAPDDTPNPYSRPGSVPKLDVDVGEGRSYEMTRVVIMSRPLVWTAYQMVYYMDTSVGRRHQYDFRLSDPSYAGLRQGAFIRTRLWSTSKDNVELYNKKPPFHTLTAPDQEGAYRRLIELLA